MYRKAKRLRRNHFNRCAMTQDIHDKLPFISIGYSQLKPPISKKLPALFRMPAFIRYPARAFCREAQHRRLVRLAGKDAVTAGVVVIQFFFGDINCFVRCF